MLGRRRTIRVPLRNRPPPPGTRSISEWRESRGHMVNFIDGRIIPILDNPRFRAIALKAPVKSGKREFVEYIATLDSQPNTNNGSRRKHIFISGFHRKADSSQRLELTKYGIEVFSINTNKNAIKCITCINNFIAEGKHIVVHFDEADHGSGATQIMSSVWSTINNIDVVFVILYSATIEEILRTTSNNPDEHQHLNLINNDMLDASTLEIIGDNCVYTEYSPPDIFCGPSRFLDEGLVENATPFYYDNNNRDQSFILSTQGCEIINSVKESMQTEPLRNIIVVRLSYMEDNIQATENTRLTKKDKKAFHRFVNNLKTIDELENIHIIIDKDPSTYHIDPDDNINVLVEQVQWSNRAYWSNKQSTVPIIVIMDMTSCRSTEWAFHNRLYALHDFRKNSIHFSILSQAQERPNHYSTKYNGFQKIRIYGNIPVFEYSAGRISASRFLESNKYLRYPTEDGLYIVSDRYNIMDESGRHPDCPEEGLTEFDSMLLLQKEASHCTYKISPRVDSKRGPSVSVNCKFFPCSGAAEMLDSVITSPEFIEALGNYSHHTFQTNIIFNTRNEDGKYLGHRFGAPLLFTFDNLVNNPSWGFSRTHTNPRITPCYRGAELGICLRTYNGMQDIGHEIKTSTRSMYAITP